MRKITTALLIVAFLFIASAAIAAPYLVSDPTPATDGVTNFKLIFDGGIPIDSAPDATKAVRYDLAGISEGTHTVVGKACNAWGCSVDSAPFTFNKKIPSAPGILRIAP